jgi:hypothetical protein
MTRKQLVEDDASASAYGVIHVYPAGQVVARIGTNADFSLFFSFRQEV